jgi:hypothetical protein
MAKGKRFSAEQIIAMRRQIPLSPGLADTRACDRRLR